MTFSDAGTVASLLSLVIGVWVLYDVRKLKNTVKLKIRGPIVTKELGKYASSILRCSVRMDTNRPQIIEELLKVDAKLNYLESALPSSRKKSVRLLRRTIRECDINVANKRAIQGICAEIQAVIEEMKDYQRDIRLGV